jgi:hypothetical protein
MTISSSTLPLWILLSLGACADQSLDGGEDVCTQAADTLVACGRTLDQSPFGTCQPDQAKLAQEVVDIHDREGCAGLADAKADSWTCTALPFLCTQHSTSELAPFTTDGCSMFPDGTLSDPTRWQHCCVTHDFAYYRGGSEEEREAADLALRSCIRADTNDALAELMWAGVRFGGTPALPTPWRWGYGWAYDPLNGYRTLTAAEAHAANAAVDGYRAHPVPPLAIEQRLRALAADIARVPGLQHSIDLLNAVIAQLD